MIHIDPALHQGKDQMSSRGPYKHNYSVGLWNSALVILSTHWSVCQTAQATLAWAILEKNKVALFIVILLPIHCF